MENIPILVSQEKCFSFISFFLIGGQLFYNVVLVIVSAAQQCGSALSIHISPPSCVSFPTPDAHPSRSSQKTPSCVPCALWHSPLALCLHTVLYICQYYLLNSSRHILCKNSYTDTHFFSSYCTTSSTLYTLLHLVFLHEIPPRASSI